MEPSPTLVAPPSKTYNLGGYEECQASYDWKREEKSLSGLPGNGGLNIAYEAVERHATGVLSEAVALRFLKKDADPNNLTFKELNLLTSQFANVLAELGVKKGDRVFVLTGRIPELYISAFGTLKSGAVFCPLYAAFGPEPVFQRLSRGDARILITTKLFFMQKVEQFLDRLPSLVHVLLIDQDQAMDAKVLSLPRLMESASGQFTIPPTKKSDPALLHFTSGTTGLPKGALHVHGAVLMHYATGKYVLDFKKGDIFWCTADPGWVTGTSYGIISPLVNGVTNIVDTEDFDASRWYKILEEQRVNVWYTAPTAIRRLMRTDIVPKDLYGLGALRVIASVGEPLHADSVLWGRKAFGLSILDNWWQTETGGIMIANFPGMKVKPGSMGKPLPGIQAAIAEISGDQVKLIKECNTQGNLVIMKGWPSMFITYLHDDDRYEKCFKGDWYITGDLAKMDEDGYFWFVGRSDDIIKTSGHLIGPFDVESVLMEHPAVAEAAVIGKPEAVIGELIKAFIVLKPGFQADENQQLEIIGYARKRLGAAVAPRELSFTDKLPKTKSGKILRRLLRAIELGLPQGDTSTLEEGL